MTKDELQEKRVVALSELKNIEVALCLDEHYIDIIEKENAELKSIAEFQQSSNMKRHFEIQELKKKNKELDVFLNAGTTFNKALNSTNKTLEEERDKYRNMVFDQKDQLTKAKEFLNEFMRISKASDEDFEHDYSELIGETEQFLKEIEK